MRVVMVVVYRPACASDPSFVIVPLMTAPLCPSIQTLEVAATQRETALLELKAAHDTNVRLLEVQLLLLLAVCPEQGLPA